MEESHRIVNVLTSFSNSSLRGPSPRLFLLRTTCPYILHRYRGGGWLLLCGGLLLFEVEVVVVIVS